MIKVRIESLGRIDTAYYKYLLKYPPKNIKFLNNINPEDTIITSSGLFLKRLKIKRIISKLLKYSNIPKFKITRYDRLVDVYHSSHIFLITKKPYIMDFEHFWILSFTSESSYGPLGRKLIKKLFNKNNLRFILPWTKAAYYTIPKEIRKDPKIKDKIKIIYPGIPAKDYPEKNNKPVLIFITRYGFMKGEPLIFKIYSELYRRYKKDIELVMISPLAKNEKIRKKYDFIKFYDVLPQKEVHNILKRSYILVYPREIDTFGFSIVEAMSFGVVPVVIDGFARKEIVGDGKTGYVIEKTGDGEIVEQFVNATSKLIDNSRLWKKLSKNAFNEVKYGKFSIEKRNNIIGEIYEEAIT